MRTLDLNLLPPLRALLEECSVSRAAERLHVSQPAMSGALARLRQHFDDPLLVRRGNRYDLSPLALQLVDRVQSATRAIDHVFAAQADFDPATSTREYQIFGSDYAVATLGGPLGSLLSERAPNARLSFLAASRGAVDSAVEALRDADGMLMPHGLLKELPYLDLFLDRWVCVVDTANSRVGDSVTLDELRELPWVSAYSSQTEFTPAGKHLQSLGITPHTVIGVAGFLSIPALIAGTDRIALMQGSLAERVAARGEVRVLECPFDPPPFREAFWWHPIHHRDPEHLWLRSLLREAVPRAGFDLLDESGHPSP